MGFTGRALHRLVVAKLLKKNMWSNAVIEKASTGRNFYFRSALIAHAHKFPVETALPSFSGMHCRAAFPLRSGRENAPPSRVNI